MRYAHSNPVDQADSGFKKTAIQPVSLKNQSVESTVTRNASACSTETRQRSIDLQILLQQYSLLPYTKKIEYIKERAPDDVIETLRLLIVNVLYGNLPINDICQKKLLDLDCEWLCCKILDDNIAPRRARRLLTCPKLVRFIDSILPNALKLFLVNSTLPCKFVLTMTNQFMLN